MSRRHSYWLVGVSLACHFPAVFAEETILDAIMVNAGTGQNLHQGSAVVDDATLQALRSATSDSASLLGNVPGLTINGAGAVSGIPSIRGLANDRLRIKVDGMDLIPSCPNQMNPPMSYVDPSNVGGIRVFAGISPVSSGGDSIGGTILVETRAPEFATPGEGDLAKGELGAFYRSNNDAYGGNAAATYATETASISYNGSWSQADNYRAGDDFKTSGATGRVGHTLPLDEVGSTAYETQNHTLGLAVRRGSHLFDVELGYQDMPEQLFPNQRMDLVDNEQKRGSLGWTGGFPWGILEAQVYHEQVDHVMDFGPDKRFWYGMDSMSPEVGTPCSPVGASCAAGMPMYTESRTTGASLHAEVDLTPGNLLRVGAEVQAYRLDDYWEASGGGMWPGTFLNINDGQRDRNALFAEWESQLNPQWLGLLGVRYERVTTEAGKVHGYQTTTPAPGSQADRFNASDREQVDNNWDVTALANYRHSDMLDIELGAARKVRSPNLYERYTWSTGAMAAIMNNFAGDGNGYVGDPGLEPEKAYTVSASVNWHSPDHRWELELSPYYTRVVDYIDAVALDPATFQPETFNVLQYANQSARLYGIDLSGKSLLARNDWGTWGLEGMVSYVNGKNRDTGDELYNMMPLNGRFTLTHQQVGWDNAIEWVLVSSKDDGSEVRNEIPTPGYGLLNLRTSHSWENVRVDLGVENLMDKLYYLPTGGAYTGQGSTMSITGVDWGVAVPGMGRSLYAGVTVTF
ncbi:TonB-dependent receptor [Marinobacter lacisalsi]|uniref:TonB-dependent receptor n=1 Tax=Marinobacter lacisalsi TaxID=475979 RepID=A0ABV8QJD9_9GAMM